MIKKITKIIFITIFVLSMSIGKVNADNSNVHLSVVDETSAKAFLENEQGYIEKSIVDYDSDKCEFTVKMTLNNTKTDKSDNNEDTEIFFVIDNSPSMDFVTESGKTRKQLVVPAALELANSIFDTMSNVKVGIVDFRGGVTGMNCATLIQGLTDDKETIVQQMNNELAKHTMGGTNILAGLKLAQNNFSEENNKKIVILLTDGIPNADLEGSAGDTVRSETALSVQAHTKEAILDLKNDGIYTITLLTGMSESDGRTDRDGNTYTPSYTIEDELAAAERVFGTTENPTADAYYLVKTVDVNKVLNEDIYNLISSKINQKMDAIKIIDYIPDSIANNFDMSYVQGPDVGDISENIDDTNNSIKWEIETLRGGESASVTYKFKLKENADVTDIIDTIIPISLKVDLSYTDLEKVERTATMTEFPKIKLTADEEEFSKNKQTADEEELPGIIPKTGSSNKIIIGGIVLVIATFVFRKKINKK